jgi:hypothetical protein
MSGDAAPVMRVLIHHGDTTLAKALAADLRQAGHLVFHEQMPQGQEPDHVVIASPDPGKGDRPERGSVDSELARMIDEAETMLPDFLSTLQSAGRRLMRREGGQIWVLTHDGSMRYYMPEHLPGGDTLNRAKQAAVKSMAKELMRFGIRVNCANVQTLAEHHATADWQAGRGGLKAYAMRFVANPASAVAGTLHAFMRQPDLPFSGVVLPVGIGLQENNL